MCSSSSPVFFITRNIITAEESDEMHQSEGKGGGKREAEERDEGGG